MGQEEPFPARRLSGPEGSLAGREAQTKNLAQQAWGQDFRRNLPVLLNRKGFGAYETAGAAFKTPEFLEPNPRGTFHRSNQARLKNNAGGGGSTVRVSSDQ